MRMENSSMTPIQPHLDTRSKVIRRMWALNGLFMEFDLVLHRGVGEPIWKVLYRD